MTRSKPPDAPRERRAASATLSGPPPPNTQQLHVHLRAYFYSAPLVEFYSALDKRSRTRLVQISIAILLNYLPFRLLFPACIAEY
jgi:hypothetical protein